MGQACSTGNTESSSNKSKDLFESYENNFYDDDDNTAIIVFDSKGGRISTKSTSFDYSAPGKQELVAKDSNKCNIKIAPSNTFETEETESINYGDDYDDSDSMGVNEESHPRNKWDDDEIIFIKQVVTQTTISPKPTNAFETSAFPFSPSSISEVSGETEQYESLAPAAIPRKIVFHSSFSEKIDSDVDTNQNNNRMINTQSEKEDHGDREFEVSLSSNIESTEGNTANNCSDGDAFLFCSSTEALTIDVPTKETGIPKEKMKISSDKILGTTTTNLSSRSTLFSSILPWPFYDTTTTADNTTTTTKTTTDKTGKATPTKTSSATTIPTTKTSTVLAARENPFPPSSLSSMLWPLSTMIGQFCYKSCSCLFFNSTSSTLLYPTSSKSTIATTNTPHTSSTSSSWWSPFLHSSPIAAAKSISVTNSSTNPPYGTLRLWGY